VLTVPHLNNDLVTKRIHVPRAWTDRSVQSGSEQEEVGRC